LFRRPNGNSERQHSRLPDARGMAIKLMGVEGPKLLDDIDPDNEKLPKTLFSSAARRSSSTSYATTRRCDNF
jgi:hypothetical protein